MTRLIRTIPFQDSQPGSLGVEMEWMTVDQTSGGQIPAGPDILALLPPSPRIKQELFTSTVEINTGIHTDTASCLTELSQLYQQVHRTIESMGGTLLSSGTHPFSRWQDQQISDDERYYRLLDRLQWMARRFNIFGVHVHIGMPDGDTCIQVMNRLLPVMPMFLAISANSPFWRQHDTGLASSRIKIFEGLSQGGMPFYFQNWRDFEHCADRLLATDSIDSVRDIWWEMRPHPDFGTLEVRIGDMPFCRSDTLAYVAYVRAEAMASINAPPVAEMTHPSLIRENRWRACRYGMRAIMIDPTSETPVPVLDWLTHRLDTLAKMGANPSDIDIVHNQLPTWKKNGDGASRQRQLHKENNEFSDMIRAMRSLDEWPS